MVSRFKLCLVLVLAYFYNVAESADILALFSSLSFADHQVFRAYLSRLAQVGHNVVAMTAYPGHFAKQDIERIIEIDVSHESVLFWNEWRSLVTDTDDYYTRLRAINEFSVRLAIAQLKSKPMQTLLMNPNVKFNLVITEADVPLFYAAADKYHCPHIAITTSSGRIHQYEAKGTPVHPNLYPDVNTLNYGNLTYWQKFTEFRRHIQTKREYYNNYLPLCETAAQNIFGLARDLQEVEYDIDLLFVVANPLLIGNRPVVPAVVYPDRLHIRPGLPLPQNLNTILNQAEKGFVYFSLGAVQDSESLAPELLQTLADGFRELPYTVLWKIGNTSAINKPDNVIAGAWFPQQEILAHPNIKAFITHGGPRSLEEAVYYSVPIIGLPIVKSRKVFIQEITKFGAGEILDPYNLDKEELKATISVVASRDNKYKQAMIKLKSMVVDPYISGPEGAIWWTEFVLRHGGAQHLRPTAAGISFFKYYLLDMVVVLLIGAFIMSWISYITLRYTVKRVRVRYLRMRNFDSDDRKFKAL